MYKEMIHEGEENNWQTVSVQKGAGLLEKSNLIERVAVEWRATELRFQEHFLVLPFLTATELNCREDQSPYWPRLF